MALVYHYNTQELPAKAPWKGDFPSEHRALQFYQSRMALWMGLPEEMRQEWGWRDLEIQKHLHLKDNPQLLVSLSHTKNVGGAVVAEASDKLLSVGIDLEWSSRGLKERMEKFFIHENDDLENYSPLQLWSLKEAAFKAISPLLENWPYKRFVLKHIWIQKESFGLIGSSQVLGTLQLEKEQLPSGELLISLASLEELPSSSE